MKNSMFLWSLKTLGGFSSMGRGKKSFKTHSLPTLIDCLFNFLLNVLTNDFQLNQLFFF